MEHAQDRAAQDMVRLEEQLRASEHTQDRAAQDIARLEEELRVARQQQLKHEEDATVARRHADAARSEASKQQSLVNDLRAAFEGSISWKVTHPLRVLAMRVPWAGPYGRRLSKVPWYTATFQFNRVLRPAYGPSVSFAGQPAARFDAGPNAGIEVGPPPSLVEARPRHEAGQALVPKSAPPPWLSDRSKSVALIIDSIYPQPDTNSGSVDAVNFIRIFQRLGYQVVFISDSEFSARSPHRATIEAMGVHCIHSPHYGSIEEFLRTKRGSTHGRLLPVACAHRRPPHQNPFRRRCHECQGDIQYREALHHLREEREARITGNRLALNLASGIRERELSIARLADATIVVSRQEEGLLAAAIPGTPVQYRGSIRDIPERVNHFSQRRGIGFIGSYLHRPNIDALNHFLSDIWPRVHERLPNVEFLAMGADMPEEFKCRREIPALSAT